MLGAKVAAIDSFGNEQSVYPGWKNQLEQIDGRLLLLVCAVIFLLSARSTKRPSVPALLALTLVVVGMLSTYAAGDAYLTSGTAILIGMLLACAFLEGRSDALLGVAVVAALTVGLSLAAGIFQPESVFLECVADYKCGPLGYVYSGAMGDSNGLALVLAGSLPFVWLALAGWTRHALCIAMLVTIWFSGSRTGLYAAVATYSLMLLLLIGSRIGVRLGATSVLSVASTAAFVAGVAIPWVGLRFDELTGRPYLWYLAIQDVNERWLLGSGSRAWAEKYTEQGRISIAATYSAHNQWIDVLFSGGILSFMVLIVLLAVCIVQSRSPASVVLLVFPVLAGGIAERLWNIGASDWLSFLYVAFLIYCRPSSADDDEAGEVGGAARAAGTSARAIARLQSSAVAQGTS
ncbi:O-antigen ligase family protein [Actinomycetospora sp. CA-101289]|uniref:O-antigen ligase family protein n=1 Tax=Actinomycetospora sp. CA-101289 TaxID=3239893 RepID=UPI003D99C522